MLSLDAGSADTRGRSSAMATRRPTRPAARPKGPKRKRSQRTTLILRWSVVGVAALRRLPLLPAALELPRDPVGAERARGRGAAAPRGANPPAGAARRLGDGRGARARGAADEPRPPRRAALHRQGRRRSGGAGRRARRPGYAGRRWMTARSSSDSSAGRPRAFRRVAARCPSARRRSRSRRRTTTRATRSRRPTTSPARSSWPRSRGWKRRAASSAGARSSSAIRSSPPTSSAPPASSGAIRRELADGRTGRDGGSSLELGIGGSGNPRRLKCLHAHAAYALAQPGLPRSGSGPGRARPALAAATCCSAL